MTKERWMCLLLIAAALAAGILIGERLRGPNRMTMMITTEGKVYPSPDNGDILTWIDEKGVGAPVAWDGPDSSTNSPCKDDSQSDAGECKVQYKSKDLNTPYHYKCNCPDLIVKGPHANGGRGTHHGTLERQPTIGTEFYARASPNKTVSPAVSGVYYFAPDDETSGYVPIPVATYGAATKNDQIIWEKPLDGTPWKIVMPDATICKEGMEFSSANGINTCTVLASATSQYYCVVYGANSAANAQLKVDTKTFPVTPPTPMCTLP